MARARRKASFIGSNEWWNQDVEHMGRLEPYAEHFRDKPSGVSITYYAPTDEARAQRELAHRVKQLTF